MIEGAFTYPTEQDDWVKTLVIGGVLTFLGFLLLPLFVVEGYVVKTIQDTIEGESTPPAFEDWAQLLSNGFLVFVIGIVYLIIPAIVAFVTIGGSIAAMATGNEMGAGLGVAGLFGGVGLTAILALLFSYVAVAGIANFAHEGRLGAAFDVSQLRTIALNSDFAVAWVVSVVVFIVAGAIAGIPFIGFILGPFASFYAVVVAARLWAGGYMDALGLGGSVPDPEMA